MLPPGVRIGLSFSAVTSMRVTARRPFPEPLEPGRLPGETHDALQRRVAAWRALAQEVSVAWDAVPTMASEGGFCITEGALLSHGDHVAMQLVATHPANGSQEVRIVVAAGAMRWLRSDGVPWDVEKMLALHQHVWREPRRALRP